MLPLVTATLPLVNTLIERVLPDKKAQEKAKLEMLKLQEQGDLKELELSMSAIVAEAKSNDKWTSRARPSFLYTMYVLILSAIPMGIIFAFAPDIANAVTTGVKNWLFAIPEEMWTLFGAGYLGYTGARSYEKHKLTR
jgi:hypothetical protein